LLAKLMGRVSELPTVAGSMPDPAMLVCANVGVDMPARANAKM
jgi:hypothetical protein